MRRGRRKLRTRLALRLGVVAASLMLVTGATAQALIATHVITFGAGGNKDKTDGKEPPTPHAQLGASTDKTPTAPGNMPTPSKQPAAYLDLIDPGKKEIAMQLVSSAENSSLDWKAQYSYIEYNVEHNAQENRGYTGGIIGFTSRTGDMLELVQKYQQIAPGNILAKYLPALQQVNGTPSQNGLGNGFVNDWKAAAGDPRFRQAQDAERDSVYFTPAFNLAKGDGLHTLGQFMYYDAAVMHGPDDWGGGLPNIRAAALAKAKPPAQGGDEKTWLNAFLDARKTEMLKEEGHSDTSRVDTMQRKFLNEGNLGLNTPLAWSVYGDPFKIER